MPKVLKQLTKTEIKNLKPKTNRYDKSDGENRFIRVYPSGKKSWFYRYKKPNGKFNNLYLGDVELLEVSYARERARQAASIVLQGKDPALATKESQINHLENHQRTLKVVAEEWFALKEKNIVPKYAKEIWQSLTKYIFPDLAKIPISEIGPQLVKKVLDPIAAQNKKETVKRLCQRLNEIMTYAVNLEYIEHNRIANIYKTFDPPSKHNMPSIKPADLPVFMKWLTTLNAGIQTRVLIEWQLRTMVRPGEAARARWEEIDFSENIWILPMETMKKRREHVVPLTPQMLNLLNRMKPISEHRPYIFPGQKNPLSHMNESTANMALKRNGYKNKLVAHGMRAIASTALHESGLFDPKLIEVCLAHLEQNETIAAYNRGTYLVRRREAMQWWNDLIDRAATGNMSLSV